MQYLSPLSCFKCFDESEDSYTKVNDYKRPLSKEELREEIAKLFEEKPELKNGLFNTFCQNRVIS